MFIILGADLDIYPILTSKRAIFTLKMSSVYKLDDKTGCCSGVLFLTAWFDSVKQ